MANNVVIMTYTSKGFKYPMRTNISCWQVCVPDLVINCSFSICSAVGRTVLCPAWGCRPVWPGWFGNGLVWPGLDNKGFGSLGGAVVLVKVLTLSWTRVAQAFVLVCEGLLSSCITCAFWPLVHQSCFWDGIDFFPIYCLIPWCCLFVAQNQ